MPDIQPQAASQGISMYGVDSAITRLDAARLANQETFTAVQSAVGQNVITVGIYRYAPDTIHQTRGSRARSFLERKNITS